MSSEVELRSGMTPRALAIAIPLALIFAFLSVIVGLYTDKSGTFGTFVLPMIYLIIVFELLGRANPKLRLTPPEYVFIFTIFTFLGMHSYLTMHAAGHNNPLNFPIITCLSDYVAFGINDLRDFWSQAIPSVIIPPEPIRFQIADMLMNGRAPGQPIPWGYLMPGIVYWGLVTIFYSFISMFVAFTVGKVWIEEERLVFPLAVPSLYLFQEAGEVDPTTNKARLFDLSHAATKVFWAMFIIGVIGGIQPLITELFPAFPGGAWWGEQKIDITFLAAIWPGVYASFIFNIPQIAVGLVMPNDALISLILGWVIFGVIYQGLAVSMGIVPYQAGMEFVWPWEDYPGVWMPFPYRWVAANGIALGIVIWILYRNRARFKEVFSTLWKGDINERGVSLRIISTLLLLGAIGWYILIVIDGGDPIVSLLVPLWAFLFNILYARVYAEVFWHVGTGWGWIWEPTYLVGYALRGWPDPVTVQNAGWDNPVTNPAWFTINRHITNMGNWNISFSPLSSGHMVTLYKLAYDLKMKLKDFLAALILGLLIFVFVFVPLDVYFLFSTKGGLSQLGHLYGWWPWTAAGQYHRGRWLPEGLTVEYDLGVVYGFGILLALILYILKTKVSLFWFISVPALFVAMTIPNYMWFTSLVALIIKYVAIRTVGIKKYEQYAMPAVSGWIIGFGAMWLLAALVNLAGVAWPNYINLFQP